MSFSKVVRLAKKKGYTEPDPRDDLSGLDVARKTLILARLIGSKKELKDVKVESLYSRELSSLSVIEFLNQIEKVDNQFRQKIQRAKKKGNVLRYVAQISNKLSIGIKEVAKTSDIGSLEGTDNIAILKTKRYNKNKLVIKGPGAGLEVTAAGVLGDLLKVIRIFKGDAI